MEANSPKIELRGIYKGQNIGNATVFILNSEKLYVLLSIFYYLSSMITFMLYNTIKLTENIAKQ